MIDRREFLITGRVFAFAAPLQTNFPAKVAQGGAVQANKTDVFWPGGARLVISISMRMEAGAQPESPLPKIGHRYPDFMRKVDIANYAITSPHTVREDI